MVESRIRKIYETLLAEHGGGKPTPVHPDDRSVEYQHTLAQKEFQHYEDLVNNKHFAKNLLLPEEERNALIDRLREENTHAGVVDTKRVLELLLPPKVYTIIQKRMKPVIKGSSAYVSDAITPKFIINALVNIAKENKLEALVSDNTSHRNEAWDKLTGLLDAYEMDDYHKKTNTWER